MNISCEREGKGCIENRKGPAHRYIFWDISKVNDSDIGMQEKISEDNEKKFLI